MNQTLFCNLAPKTILGPCTFSKKWFFEFLSLKQTEAKTCFFSKICTKECLEIEDFQVVWCGHLEKCIFLTE